jgi:hypothetical protein
MKPATSRVENLAQGSSCQLKFVHGVFDGTELERDDALKRVDAENDFYSI